MTYLKTSLTWSIISGPTPSPGSIVTLWRPPYLARRNWRGKEMYCESLRKRSRIKTSPTSWLLLGAECTDLAEMTGSHCWMPWERKQLTLRYRVQRSCTGEKCCWWWCVCIAKVAKGSRQKLITDFFCVTLHTPVSVLALALSRPGQSATSDTFLKEV